MCTGLFVDYIAVCNEYDHETTSVLSLLMDVHRDYSCDSGVKEWLSHAALFAMSLERCTDIEKVISCVTDFISLNWVKETLLMFCSIFYRGYGLKLPAFQEDWRRMTLRLMKVLHLEDSSVTSITFPNVLTDDSLVFANLTMSDGSTAYIPNSHAFVQIASMIITRSSTLLSVCGFLTERQLIFFQVWKYFSPPMSEPHYLQYSVEINQYVSERVISVEEDDVLMIDKQ